MHKGMLALVALMLTWGCSTTQKITVPGEAGTVTVIDYSASRRGAYLIKTTDGKTVIVSEPSPDIAKDITGSLGLSAETIGSLVKPELKAEYAMKVVDLASRSQTLQVLRESLFRLSEIGASADLKPEERARLFSRVLETVRLIAVTEFANSNAPDNVKNETLKRFLQDTATGTVDVP